MDASSAISIASRAGLGQTRHIQVRHLWLQQVVSQKLVRLVKVAGATHPPDVGTKFLSRELLEQARSSLGLVDLQDVPEYKPLTGAEKVKDRYEMASTLHIALLVSWCQRAWKPRPCVLLLLGMGYLPRGAKAAEITARVSNNFGIQFI
eukprot:6486729-Amphidinium_carterae.3